MGLYGIYRRGDDAWTMLQTLRRQIEVSTAEPGEPATIDERVDALNDQLMGLQAIWAGCPQSPADKEMYDLDVRNHQRAIEHLERLAKASFKDKCLDGLISAFGYRHTGDLEPAPIPPNEWAFLQLDFASSDAHYEDIRYKAVRFVWTRRLTKDDWKAIQAVLLQFPEVWELPEEEQEEALNAAFAKLKASADPSDKELGQAYRQRMAEMGSRRQSEAATNQKWWEPYIKEGNTLVAEGKSKSNAAEIVAQRHPEANINPGTLRQKLKS
ncbi:MAG: hypothetical protein ACE5FN_03450 [Leptospirillia bacterium]